MHVVDQNTTLSGTADTVGSVLFRRPVVEYFFALRVCIWLGWATVRLRHMPFPDFLTRVAPSLPATTSQTSLSIDRVESIVHRVCRLSLFKHAFFPRICLRQSLALYRFLRRLGHPVRLHVSVFKDAVGDFEAHCWTTLHGEPLAHSAPPVAFREILVHPKVDSCWEPPFDQKRAHTLGGNINEKRRIRA